MNATESRFRELASKLPTWIHKMRMHDARIQIVLKESARLGLDYEQMLEAMLLAMIAERDAWRRWAHHHEQRRGIAVVINGPREELDPEPGPRGG